MANQTYRRTIKIRPFINRPELIFGGGLVVDNADGLLLIAPHDPQTNSNFFFLTGD